MCKDSQDESNAAETRTQKTRSFVQQVRLAAQRKAKYAERGDAASEEAADHPLEGLDGLEKMASVRDQTSEPSDQRLAEDLYLRKWVNPVRASMNVQTKTRPAQATLAHAQAEAVGFANGLPTGYGERVGNNQDISLGLRYQSTW